MQVPPPFSPSWLYRFWRLVPVPVGMELFARWPLVPTTGGDLVSCRLAPAVMRLSLEHLNTDLQVHAPRQAKSRFRFKLDLHPCSAGEAGGGHGPLGL